MVICLERGADLHMAQLMLLPLTVSCFSKIQIGFTFLVPAHLGSPGKRAVKRVSVCLSLNRLSSMPLYMEAIREDSHTPGRGMHVMIKTSHKETYVVSGTGFLWPDAHLSYNQWCQSTKGNSKHWCKPVTWPHPFLIHHHTSGKRWRSLNASSLWQHMKDRNVTEPTIRNSLPDNVISDLFLSTFRQHPKHLSSASFQIFVECL